MVPLVFNISEVLDAQAHGGSEVGASNCNSMHNGLLNNKLQHRYLLVQHIYRAATFSAATEILKVLFALPSMQGELEGGYLCVSKSTMSKRASSVPCLATGIIELCNFRGWVSWILYRASHPTSMRADHGGFQC
jgi:hypothetical protein